MSPDTPPTTRGSLRSLRRGRGPAGCPARSLVIGWLDRRVNFERLAPHGGSFGLARMRRLLAAVGRPQDRLRVAHVAGTKGKGSTVAMLAAILQAAGHRTGRYLSPHVHALEERICIDGRPISARELVAVFEEVIPAVEALDRAAAARGRRGPTWFEAVTAAALVHFARAGVDIAVMETGLGGRLDATNVTRPDVSVITSISLDHMAVLGPTVAHIAAEKAGIIKRGCPVVSGALHPAARRVITATARRRRAPLVQLGRDFHAHYEPPRGSRSPLTGWVRVEPASPDGRRVPRLRLGMPGRHQAENAALAVTAALELDRAGFRVPPAALAAGIAAARLPARIETLSRRPLVILDAAHNVASMEALVETLTQVLAAHRPRVLVFAASADKQIEEMLAVTSGRFDAVVVTRYATNPRAAPVERLAAACVAAGLPQPGIASEPRAALAAARGLAGRPGIVVVAGSFFLATEVRG